MDWCRVYSLPLGEAYAVTHWVCHVSLTGKPYGVAYVGGGINIAQWGCLPVLRLWLRSYETSDE